MLLNVGFLVDGGIGKLSNSNVMNMLINVGK